MKVALTGMRFRSALVALMFRTRLTEKREAPLLMVAAALPS